MTLAPLLPLLIIHCSLATRGADFGDGSTYLTYRNVSTWFLVAPLTTNLLRPSQQVILSVIGVPGALLAGWTVELPYLGRRGSLAISTGTCIPPID